MKTNCEKLWKFLWVSVSPQSVSLGHNSEAEMAEMTDWNNLPQTHENSHYSKMLISVAYFHTSLSCLYASIHVFPLLLSRFTHFHTHLWWYLHTNFSQVAWEIRGRIVIGHFSIIKRNGPAESSYVSKIQILISLHKQNYSLIGNYGIKMLFISLCFLHTLHKISNFIFTVLKNTLT